MTWFSVGEPKDSTKRWLELTRGFGKVVGEKSTEKSISFLQFPVNQRTRAKSVTFITAKKM